MLQQRIDDVLEGVRLSDLLHEEGVVRERVGLSLPAVAFEEREALDDAPAGRRLPILQA
jgi:hypothetical protein